MIGRIVDRRYKVLKELGAGGMGKVYEAEHLGTGRRVGLKVLLNPDLELREDSLIRFEREARTSATLETKHICEIIDTGVDSDTQHPYLVMELMRGEDCLQLVRRLGPLVPEVALRIVAQICVGLKKAHQAGVVHRDIKPSNIFLSEKDEGEVTVKLLDFGIAKLVINQPSSGQMQLTQTGAVLGSPRYMSPEQAFGEKKLDHRADLWSLGVVLYQLLCGKTPYHHIEALGELLISICNKSPEKISVMAPWVEPKVAQIVEAALTQDPNSRFQSADEMLSALLEVLPDGHALQQSELVGVSEDNIALMPASTSTFVPAAERPFESAMMDNSDDYGRTDANLSSTTPTRKLTGGFGSQKKGALALMGLSGVGGLVFYLASMNEHPSEKLTSEVVLENAPTSASASGDSRSFSQDSPLKLMSNSFSGYSTFRAERFRSMFSAAEFDFRYIEEIDAHKTLASLGTGDADLVTTTLDNLLLQPVDGKVVALLDTTLGADAIVLNLRQFPNLTSLPALEQLVQSERTVDRKPFIAYTPDTPSEFLARLLSARLDSFEFEAFEAIEVNEPKEAWEKLIQPNSGVAAAVLWEPYVSKAREAGYPVVLSSGDVPGSIQDVLVASNRLIEESPQALQSFISNYYRHIDRVTANPKLMYRQIAQDGDLNDKEAKSVVTGIRFTTALGAKRRLESGEFSKRLRAIASVLVIDGELDQLPGNFEDFFDARFVEKAAENTIKLIEGLQIENPRAAQLLEQGGRGKMQLPRLRSSVLKSAETIGELGHFEVEAAEKDDFFTSPQLKELALKLADFSSATTVVTLEGGPASEEQRKQVRQKLEQSLRRRGLMHQVSELESTGAGLFTLRLRRRPESQ